MLHNFVERTAGRPVEPTVLRNQWVHAPKEASKRIIACLDVRDGAVVKGVKFEGLRTAGDPAELAARYNIEGIDEVVILDVTATLESRRALARTIADVARRLFIPLAVGGGIRTEDDAAAVVDAGADKVSLNTAALVDPDLITRLAVRYGSQAVVVAIDAKRQRRSDGRDGFAVYSRSGSHDSARQAVEWAQEAAARGAGEILLTSIDKDGTRSGFDCELTAAVSGAVSIPVIASGGAGELDHFVDVFTRGRADAALAASIFHFAERGVSALKQHLAKAGIPVRLEGSVPRTADS
jgi:cyclase